jgi:hypothetical protein
MAMGEASRGPACQVRNPRSIDFGTLALVASAPPGLQRGRSAERRELEEALKALQSQAEIFAWRFINDARARRLYVERIAASSRDLLRDVEAGVLSPAEAARIANQARNTIMEEIRAITSAIGRAGAEATKATGLTLEAAIEKSVKKLFPGKGFAELSTLEKRAVFMEVVEASGRSSPRFTSQIPKWTRFGKGLAVVTIAISVYNIWEAENKLRQGVKEGATLLGGALGGAAATASAGFVCGPGAPVCVTALFVIGGIAGALAADAAADYVLDQRVIVEWLGE